MKKAASSVRRSAEIRTVYCFLMRLRRHIRMCLIYFYRCWMTVILQMHREEKSTSNRRLLLWLPTQGHRRSWNRNVWDSCLIMMRRKTMNEWKAVWWKKCAGFSNRSSWTELTISWCSMCWIKKISGKLWHCFLKHWRNDVQNRWKFILQWQMLWKILLQKKVLIINMVPDRCVVQFRVR